MPALPDWLEPLFEAAEMRAADAWAIERDGVPSIDLISAPASASRAPPRGSRSRRRSAS